MAGKTDTHSDSVLNLLRGTTFTSLTTVHIGLFDAAGDPSDAGGGTEVTDGTPDREAITTTGTNLTAPVAASPGKKIDNLNDISWTSWPNASDTVGAAGLFDLLTVGTLLYWAELTTDRTIETGETATFASGDLVISED